MAVQALSREFLSHLRDHQEDGLTCELLPAQFISCSTLKDYWILDRIEAVCRHASITTHPTLIRRHYFIVFSVLVIVSNTERHALDFFDALVSDRNDDLTLPWTEPSKALRGSFDTHAHAVYKAFEAAQWPFCPVLFEMKNPLSNAQLDRRRVFPFTDKEEMGDSRVNAEARVCSVGIHRRAHEHLPNASQTPSRIVLKTYSQSSQRAYEKERRSLAALNTRTPNVVYCLGGFHWLSETSLRNNTLMLEYAEEGTLLNLFQRGQYPYEVPDVYMLWKAFLGMIKGVEMMHEQGVIHQDLKPSNILVFPSHKAEEPFDYVFKISSFGTCHIPPGELPRHGYDPDAVHARASRTYSAPKLQLGEDVQYTVESSIDMWSVGCMLVEAAVWITIGERGRQDFRNQRIKETSELPDHDELGRSDCFHDGSEVLDSVRNAEDMIRRHQRPGDNISRQLVQLVLRTLLVDQSFRSTAPQIYSQLANLIRSNGIGVETTSPRSQGPGLRPSRQRHRTVPIPQREPRGSFTLAERTASPSQMSFTSLAGADEEIYAREPPLALSKALPPSSPYPFISIERLRNWRETPWAKLPGWKQAQAELKGRDFIFVVDNSFSMQPYEDDILLFVHQLGYLVKKLDSNGLQVLMTSEPLHQETCKTSTHIKNFVKSKFRSGLVRCNMENSLRQAFQGVYNALPRLVPVGNKEAIVNRVLHGKAKPFTILVFTDGVWDGREHGLSGTDRPIEKCIRMMKEHGVDKTDVAIQFVRFGHSEMGIRRLRILDDGLKKRDQNMGYDIVDHKDRNASIWDILVGSVSALTDSYISSQASLVSFKDTKGIPDRAVEPDAYPRISDSRQPPPVPSETTMPVTEREAKPPSTPKDHRVRHASNETQVREAELVSLEAFGASEEARKSRDRSASRPISPHQTEGPAPHTGMQALPSPSEAVPSRQQLQPSEAGPSDVGPSALPVIDSPELEVDSSEPGPSKPGPSDPSLSELEVDPSEPGPSEPAFQIVTSPSPVAPSYQTEVLRAENLEPSQLKNPDQDSADVATLSMATPTAFAEATPESAENPSPDLPHPPVRQSTDDVQRITSEDEEIGAKVTKPTANEEGTKNAFIREFLAGQTEFRSLVEEMLRRLGTQKCVDNIQQLLESFHKSLTKEPQNEAGTAISKLLGSRPERHQISHQLAVEIQRRDGIWEPRASVENDPSGLSDESRPKSSHAGFDDGRYSTAHSVGAFLRESPSFQRIRIEFMVALLPLNLKGLLLSIPRKHIWVSQEQSTSLSDRAKALVEDSTRLRWDWWPLNPRKRRLNHGEARIFWKCTCGSKQWEEVPVQQSELVKKVLTYPDHQPPESLFRCEKGGLALLITQIKKLLQTVPPGSRAPPSRAAQTYTPGDTVPSSSSGAHSANQDQMALNAVTQVSSPPSSQQSVVGQQNETSLSNTPGPNSSWIIFCVHAGTRFLKPDQIEVKGDSTDSSVFKDFRNYYEMRRGLLRLWFSIWHLDHCEGTKFLTVSNDFILHEQSELPNTQDYEYNPRPPAPNAQNPPVPRDLFHWLFYACPLDCKWRLFHSHLSIDTRNNQLQKIPKRSQRYEHSQGDHVWGLEVIFAVSAIHVIVYHVLILAGPFSFWWWWLASHDDDLQNASVPLALVLCLLSLFWATAGILTEREHPRTRSQSV